MNRCINAGFLLQVVLLLITSGSLAAPRPNIVLILADDLGYGDIGCYGSKINQTPNLDRLAAGGMRFTDFHSNGPMCTPTRAALLTGLYQNRFGRRFEAALSAKRGDAGLPLEAVTLAELLAETGYATGCFGKWHLGYEKPYLPTNQGFDEFRGLLSGDGDFHTQVDRSGNNDWWDGDSLLDEDGYTTDLITKHGIDFIERNKDQPFFLYLPHLAVHFPWQGPQDPPHRQQGISYHKDKFGIIPDRSNIHPHLKAMIESLDSSVGEIISTLEELKLAGNTLVIFTSDNGGYIDYRGGYKNISDMGPYRGQKTEVYEGGHRVPTIAWWPGRIKPSICDETIMTFDLFPSITKLAGISSQSLPDVDGVDFTDVLLNQQALEKRTLFWRIGGTRGVRQGDYKLCLIPKKTPEFYNLKIDPGESRNIAGKHQKRVEQMQDALAEWEKSVDQTATTFQ